MPAWTQEDQLDPEIMGWALDAAARREIDRTPRETVTDPLSPELMAPPRRSTERVPV